MSSRLASATLSMRTATRTAALPTLRCSKSPRVEHINRDTTNFATLDDSMIEPPAKIASSKPASSSLPWPVDVFAKAFEEDQKLDELCKTFILDEQQGNIARMWEPVEKELWLERFGGPGKTMEKVDGHGTVVLRDVGADGKAYLRVLI